MKPNPKTANDAPAAHSRVDGGVDGGVDGAVDAGDVEDRVIALHRESLGDPRLQLRRDEPLHDRGASSLQSVLFVSAIERAFAIELSMRDYYATASLGALASLIGRRLDDR